MNKQGITINNQLTDEPVQYGISEITKLISEQKTNQKASQLTISTKIDQLEKAAVNWHSIVETTKTIYNRMPLQHLEKSKFRYFHWENLEREVQEELKIYLQ